MLHPQQNSIAYSSGIAPPDGYELNYAVGTTYSLDLEALLQIPIAMIYASHIEKLKGSISYETISALSEVAKKIDIFCQNGNIKNPRFNNQLYSFWENSIHEVKLNNAFQSFHSKVWIMQFTNKRKESLFKVFITSRNLTQSGDWDIAYSTQGSLSSTFMPQNQPLIDFVNYLSKFSNKIIPSEFIDKLAYVDFDLAADWKSQLFLPIGIPGYQNILAKKKFDELLVISPFLDKTTISKLTTNTQTLTLCSTRDALDTIETNKLNTKNYQFNTVIETVSDNEEMFDEIDTSLLSQSLHAKLFIGKKGDTITWNLGSANATSPAFEARNIEFNIELTGKNDEYSPKQITKQLAIRYAKDGNDIKLFEPYIPSNTKQESLNKKIEEAARILIFDLLLTPIKGSISKSLNGIEYDLVIEGNFSEINFNEFTVKIKPLSCYKDSARTIKAIEQNLEFTFQNIPIENLSKFLVWEVYYQGNIVREFLTKMELDIPMDERQSKIYKSLFDSKEKLFKYISFLITNDENETINQNLDGNEQELNQKETTDTNSIAGLPIYEKLLIASSRMPHKLDAIAKLIDILTASNEDESSELLTAEFLEFWAQFEQYKINHNGENS
jgi:hypothetical protein